MEKEAIARQELHSEESIYAGIVRQYIEMPLPEDWGKMSIDERRRYANGDEFGGCTRGTVKRMRVCAAEILAECLNWEFRDINPARTREINDILNKIEGWSKYMGGSGKLYFGEKYGYQKAFVRKDSMDGQNAFAENGRAERMIL
jgi:hypothetical protein